MRRGWEIVLIALLVGIVSGCSLGGHAQKQEEAYKVIDEEIKTYLKDRYGEAFEVIGHETSNMPSSLKQYKRAICRPVATPELEFTIDYTYGYYMDFFNEELANQIINAYGKELGETLGEGEVFEVKGHILFDPSSLNHRITLEELIERQEALEVEVGMSIYIYGSYDEAAIKEKLAEIGNTLQKDFKEVYSLILGVYPEDQTDKHYLIGRIDCETYGENFKPEYVTIEKYEEIEGGAIQIE